MTKHTKHFTRTGGICLLLIAAVAGCVGVEGGGYVEGPGYVDYGPDVYVFGGYRGGHYDRDFGRRGYESRRGVPPPRGGHVGGGHPSGGHPGGSGGHGGGGGHH